MQEWAGLVGEDDDDFKSDGEEVGTADWGEEGEAGDDGNLDWGRSVLLRVWVRGGSHS